MLTMFHSLFQIFLLSLFLNSVLSNTDINIKDSKLTPPLPLAPPGLSFSLFVANNFGTSKDTFFLAQISNPVINQSISFNSSNSLFVFSMDDHYRDMNSLQSSSKLNTDNQFMFLRSNPAWNPKRNLTSPLMQLFEVNAANGHIHVGDMTQVPLLEDPLPGYTPIEISFSDFVYISKLSSWYGISIDNVVYPDNWIYYLNIFASIDQLGEGDVVVTPAISWAIPLSRTDEQPAAVRVAVDDNHNHLIILAQFMGGHPDYLVTVDLLTNQTIANVTFTTSDTLIFYSNERSILYSIRLQCSVGICSVMDIVSVDPTTGNITPVSKSLTGFPPAFMYPFSQFDESTGEWFFLMQLSRNSPLFYFGSFNVDTASVSSFSTLTFDSNDQVIGMYIQNSTNSIRINNGKQPQIKTK